jgi:Rrf2 family protein
MISTKGRYAARILVHISEQGKDAIVPLRDVARRQAISEKYLQHVAKLLVGKGLLIGTSGKGGGYRLARPASQIDLLEVLEAAEGSLAPVACLAPGAAPCDRARTCKTLPLWKRYDSLLRDFFGSITIANVESGHLDELLDSNAPA